MRIGVFCSASDDLAAEYYERARAVGEWIGSRGHEIIYGGTRQGLMEVMAQSVTHSGGVAVGILPRSMYEHGLSSPTASRLIITEDMVERKNKMMELADVFLALPGGFGTWDEIFHVVACGQIGVHSKRVILYSINDFYQHLQMQAERAFDEQFTSQVYRSRLTIVSTHRQCINELAQAE